MSLIRNLVKDPEDRPRKKKGNRSDEDESDEGPEKKRRPIVKSATDLQRLRLQRLMMDPDKPVVIPESQKEKDYNQTVPTFVRNVMGSSAGAGSGEFHVYRHLRRKEYARQKTIQAKSMRERMDDEYKEKLEENKRKAEEKTAKKRAKRLKRKRNRAKKPQPESKDIANEVKSDGATSDDDDDMENPTEGSERPEEVISTEITAALSPDHISDKVGNAHEKDNTKDVEMLDQIELEKVEPENASEVKKNEITADSEKLDQTELEKIKTENPKQGNESENTVDSEKLDQTELEKVEAENPKQETESENTEDPGKSDQTQIEKVGAARKENESENLEKSDLNQLEKVEPEKITEENESASTESLQKESNENVVDTSNTESIKENTNPEQQKQSTSEGPNMETPEVPVNTNI